MKKNHAHAKKCKSEKNFFGTLKDMYAKNATYEKNFVTKYTACEKNNHAHAKNASRKKNF